MRATQVTSEVRIALEKVGVIFFFIVPKVLRNMYTGAYLPSNNNFQLYKDLEEPYLGHMHFAIFRLQLSTVESVVSGICFLIIQCGL